jgi:hypothetical protein
MIQVTIDPAQIKALNSALSSLAVTSGESMRSLVRQQAALFQRDAVLELPPRSRSRAVQNARREVRRSVITVRSGLRFRGRKAGNRNSDVAWLFATPTGLYGAYRDMIYSTRDIQALLKAFRTSYFQMRDIGGGQKWLPVGRRGRQTIYLAGQPVMHEFAAAHIVRHIREQLGRLKASLAVGWDLLQKARSLPAWIRRHVPSARGQTTIQDAGTRASVQFKTEAYGNTHPQSLAVLRKAYRKRLLAIISRLQADWESYVAQKVKFRARPGGRALFR